VSEFANELLDIADEFPEEIIKKLTAFAEKTATLNSLNALFRVVRDWCGAADKPPVLIIDEVDYASNNQVFIDFLAQLRAYYLKRPACRRFIPWFLPEYMISGAFGKRSDRTRNTRKTFPGTLLLISTLT